MTTAIVMTPNNYDLKQQRRNARRTAWILAVVALSIFAVFIFSGVIGR
jgi:hypothetical protein